MEYLAPAFAIDQYIPAPEDPCRPGYYNQYHYGKIMHGIITNVQEIVAAEDPLKQEVDD